MAGLKEKTPVSCLQEYMVSRQMIPRYELVHNGVGTHNPVFTYRVQAGGLLEEGTGRSKREAKHRAAEKMLKSLKVTDIPFHATEEDDNDKNNMEPAENFVGQLKEYCIFKCYPDPKYYLEEAGGPPHKRIFRMTCCVSKLQDHGVSTTKKQAKHQAAWKMLQRLKEFMTEQPSRAEPKEVKYSEVKKSPDNSEEVIDKYHTLRPSMAATVNKDPLTFYKDHHRAYVSLPITSPTLLNIVNESDKIDINNSLSLITEIANELEVTLSTVEVPTIKANEQWTIMGISVYPSIAGIGPTKEKAAFDLLNSLVFLCKD